MTGIQVHELNINQYEQSWVRKLQSLARDSSTISLRVLYYDEILFANHPFSDSMETLATKEFKVSVFPASCRDYVIQPSS